MKIYLNLLTKKANSGFTLIELILASVGMFFVVMAAGYGVLVMTRENVAANAASDTQYNLGRAVDFISEEIKSSSNITADSTLSIPSACTGSGNEVGTGTATPVLGLSVNGSPTTNVIYYTQKPSSTWLGNNAIYRCGPVIDSDGAYTSSIKSHLLVDLIALANAPNDTAGCSNGGTAHPDITSGFFVCKNGNLAELHIAASALDTQANTGLKSTVADPTSSASRFADKAMYGIVSQAYTRASDGVPITLNSGSIAFTETAKATVVTSGTCSSITIAGTPYTSFPVDISSLSPSANLVTATSPTPLTVSLTSSNVVGLTNGTCTFSITLRRV